MTNGQIMTQGATSTTPTTTLPPAPGTTVDPASVAPLPGSTVNGVKVGPDDNYIAAASRGAEISLMVIGSVAAVCYGAMQLL